MKKKYRSFEEARKFVRKLNLKSQHEWKKYYKSNRPAGIPSNPNREYLGDWNGYADWLGTSTVATRERKYLNFADAKNFVQRLNLKSNHSWRKYCKSGNKPENIPAKPERTYHNLGWIGYGDWLGTRVLQTQQRKYLTYDEACKKIQKFNLKSHKEWKVFCNNKKNPIDVPTAPDLYYKTKGWISWGEFLGTGRRSEKERSKNFLVYTEARNIVQEIAKKYKIQNSKDWRDAIKRGLIPDNIPHNPWNFYSKGKKQ